MKKIILFLAICIGIPWVLLQCMGAGNAAERGLSVKDAFAYPTIGTLRVGAAFMQVTSAKDDALVSASAPVAGRVELHDVVDDNGVMRMREVQEIALPAGKTVALKSGGLHVMLFELQKELKIGDQFPLTLQLKSGGSITTQVKVEDRE